MATLFAVKKKVRRDDINFYRGAIVELVANFGEVSQVIFLHEGGDSPRSTLVTIENELLRPFDEKINVCKGSFKLYQRYRKQLDAMPLTAQQNEKT